MKHVSGFLLATLLALAAPLAGAAPVPAPGAAASSAPADADAALAQAVARRVHKVPGLDDVVVTARDGTVRLDGTVAQEQQRALAAQIAAQQKGVAAVENRLRTSARLVDRLDAASEQVGEIGRAHV